jgi:FixJ family two-component response regulator
MKIEEHIVFVVDDDQSVRASLLDLLASHDLAAVAFASACEYMAYARPDLPGCLILDIGLPDITGLDLQSRIAGSNHPPIIFITGQADIPMSVQAMKSGAVDFLTKPFGDEELLAAIKTAVARDREIRLERLKLNQLQCRFSSLTPREHDVLPLVVGGLLNKQAGAELGISEITLQIHRSKIMQKMKADSLAELVRMATQLKVPLPTCRRRGQHGAAYSHFHSPTPTGSSKGVSSAS